MTSQTYDELRRERSISGAIRSLLNCCRSCEAHQRESLWLAWSHKSFEGIFEKIPWTGWRSDGTSWTRTTKISSQWTFCYSLRRILSLIPFTAEIAARAELRGLRQLAPFRTSFSLSAFAEYPLTFNLRPYGWRTDVRFKPEIHTP